MKIGKLKSWVIKKLGGHVDYPMQPLIKTKQLETKTVCATIDVSSVHTPPIEYIQRQLVQKIAEKLFDCGYVKINEEKSSNSDIPCKTFRAYILTIDNNKLIIER